jgi:hypothetical protein
MNQGPNLATAAALLATILAALHVLFAATGGIADPPAAAWALALGTVLAAGLAWRAAKTGARWLGWPAFALCALPVLVTWPDAGLSIAGLATMGLIGLLGLTVALQLGARPQAV